MQGRLARAGGAIAVSVWLVGGVHAETRMSDDERAVVEQRVEELEAQFRRIRDQKIARCRGTWSLCTNKRCKQIQVTETSRWQTCQDACDAELERCTEIAYEYWPEDE